MAEIARLLRARGHAVEVLERTSQTASRARAGRALLAGGLDPGEVERAVRDHRADVVHAHNIHPLFGARALAAARRAGARVVMHLHNYRLVCAIAIDYRDGDVCTRCHGRNTLPGIRLRCRGNLPEAAAYGAGLARQQGASCVRRPLRRAERVRGPAPCRPGARRRARRGRAQLRRRRTSSPRRRRTGAAGTRCSRGGWSRKRAPTPRSARPPRAGVPLAIAGRGPGRAAAAAPRARARGPGHVPRPHPAGADAGAARAGGVRRGARPAGTSPARTR